MILNFATISGLDAYRWMVKLVVPRPIGWVSTVDLQGRPNLAPFSWFQSVCTSPPTLMLAAGYRKNTDGELVPKDTVSNAEQSGECVIQLAQRDQIEALVKTSASLPYGQSEFDHAGLEAVPCQLVKAPRVKGAAVAFECKVEEILIREHWKTRLIFARVLCIHIDDSLMGDDGEFIQEKWKPISRLGGNSYAEIGERFDLKRPG
jgi:flavin reductase (DIM6/NTAB) family NADH-FMN oxidoreductase RutF